MDDREFFKTRDALATRAGDLKTIQVIGTIIGLTSFGVSFVSFSFFLATILSEEGDLGSIIALGVLCGVFLLIGIVTILIALVAIRPTRKKYLIMLDELVKGGYDIEVATDMKRHMDKRYPKGYIPDSQRVTKK